MFSRVRIAIRFFFVGLAVGVLLAPRSGEETRRLVREKAEGLLNDVLDAATLGTSTGVGSAAADKADAPKAARSGDGARSRSRSRTTEVAEEAEAAAGAGS